MPFIIPPPRDLVPRTSPVASNGGDTGDAAGAAAELAMTANDQAQPRAVHVALVEREHDRELRRILLTTAQIDPVRTSARIVPGGYFG